MEIYKPKKINKMKPTEKISVELQNENGII